ncbi:MAG: hypothetical protein ACE5E5_07910 [Phycisphaerae bacterium]
MRTLNRRAGARMGCIAMLAAAVVGLGGAAPAYAGGSSVAVALVPRSAAGPVDQTAALPQPETAWAPGSALVIEVWAQTVDPNGLSSVSIDVAFGTNLSVTGVTPTALFSELTHALVDNAVGLIDDLSGSHLSPCTDQIGIAPQWARVAIVDLSANVAGVATVQALPADSMVYGTAVCGVGDVNPASITFGQATLLIGDVAIPALSDWGLVVMIGLLLVAATLVWNVCAESSETQFD